MSIVEWTPVYVVHFGDLKYQLGLGGKMGKYSKTILAIVFFGTTLIASANAIADSGLTWIRSAKARCMEPLPGEPVVYNSDFNWNMSLTEMQDRFNMINESGKRLQNRAFWSETDKQFVFSLKSGKVWIPANFLLSVKLQVENALLRDYASYVFFPDMGHSHFMMPPADFDRDVLGNQGAENKHKIYTALLNNSNLRVLYHTAEQLRMMDEQKQLIPDTFLLWRYFTRNLVGDNRRQGTLEIFKKLTGNFNTLGETETPTLKWYSAGFNISTSKNGCFSYTKGDQTFYFDLSLSDLPMDPAKASAND